jgi:type III restriction enzyme
VILVDTNEKQMIGQLWEKRTAGKGLFLMVEKSVNGKDMRAQLLDRFST